MSLPFLSQKKSLHKTLLPLLGILCFLPNTLLLAQISTYVRAIRPALITEGEPLTVTADLKLVSEISHVTLYYRPFGQSEFHSLEMHLMGDSASVEIPSSEVLPPSLEYYILVETQSGTTETFPFENPAGMPNRINIEPAPVGPSDILIMSPAEGEELVPGETYISVSFVYAGNEIDKAKTKIILNGVDLSSKAMAFDDLLIVPPEAVPSTMPAGRLQLQIDIFDTTGAQVKSLKRKFTLQSSASPEEEKPLFTYGGSALAESRSENIKGVKRTYSRLDVRVNSVTANFIKTKANLLLSSEEKPENQPQNRYNLGVDAKYVRLELGDAYPRFPNLIMDGRRVRGISGNLLLGFFNLDATKGEIVRTVQDSLPRTLRRTISTVRPSFGKGENFQWGFTYSKSIDEFNALSAQIIKPQENLVVGTDIKASFDDHRIEFSMQTALSLNNIDISSSSFTADSLDSAAVRGTLTRSDADNLKNLLPLVNKFITLNENLIPINPLGLTSLVYETNLSFNYFGNYLRGSYIYHGKDYTSFGSTSLRQDIQGFNISNRLRLLSNRVFLSLSYEVLSDNTNKSEIATTTYKTTTTSISYFPAFTFPSMTTGISFLNNSNPINPFDTLPQVAARAIDEHGIRYFLQSSYDLSSPLGSHNVTLNVDVSTKDDRTPKEQDISTFNTALGISTIHNTLPLETGINISYSSLTIPDFVVDTATSQTIVTSRSLNYQTIALTGKYQLLADVFFLSGTLAPTFGNYQRVLFEAGASYYITTKQLASLSLQYITYGTQSLPSSSISTHDLIFSALYRIEL
ncbi:MAG: hypothetical protein H3C35_12220 [Bacteroidetes bacterium]|nr:hypothetical protein [Bacteroidota bacterium]